MSTYRPFIAAVRIAFLSCATLLLAACAGAPQVETAPPVEYVWPAPPAPAVIRYVTEIRSLESVKKKNRFKDLLGGKEDRGLQSLARPYGVTTDSRGRIFVGDATLGGLYVFDAGGQFLEEWGSAGSGNLQAPLAMAADQEDNIYVCDAAAGRVVVFGADGRLRFEIRGEGILQNPTGIGINDSLGRIYVVDSRLHRVALFDLDGTHLFDITGPFGEGLGGLHYPTSIAIDPEGNLWIVDSMNFRVIALDADGKYIRHWGRLSNYIGDFSRPKGIALDSEGNVYVSDVAFNNIQVFNRNGDLLLFFGIPSGVPGGFNMPAGLFIDNNDRLYVADQYNQRIQIFEFLGSPTTPVN